MNLIQVKTNIGLKNLTGFFTFGLNCSFSKSLLKISLNKVIEIVPLNINKKFVWIILFSLHLINNLSLFCTKIIKIITKTILIKTAVDNVPIKPIVNAWKFKEGMNDK